MAKKQTKPRKQVQMHSLFDKSKKKRRDCPKCGPGCSLAQHKDRLTCGRCGYTEFISKKQ